MDMEKKRTLSNDCFSIITDSASRIHEAEIKLKEVGCSNISNVDGEMEQTEWISLEYLENVSSIYSHHCQESSPSQLASIAHLLGTLLKRTLPKVLHTQGLTIQLLDNNIHFCISASIPSNEQQTLLALLQEYLDYQQQSLHGKIGNHS